MDNEFSPDTDAKISKRASLNSLKRRLFDYKERLFIFIGVIFASALAYQAGVLQSAMYQSEPLVISLPAVVDPIVLEKEVSSKAPSLSSGLQRVVSEGKDMGLLKECMFVGSRNSNKYHLPTCAPAKRIKPENKVCFASKEDAEKRGYLAGCLK